MSWSVAVALLQHHHHHHHRAPAHSHPPSPSTPPSVRLQWSPSGHTPITTPTSAMRARSSACAPPRPPALLLRAPQRHRPLLLNTAPAMSTPSAPNWTTHSSNTACEARWSTARRSRFARIHFWPTATSIPTTTVWVVSGSKSLSSCLQRRQGSKRQTGVSRARGSMR